MCTRLVESLGNVGDQRVNVWLVALVIAKDQITVVQFDRMAPEGDLRRGVFPAQLGLMIEAGPAHRGFVL